MSENQLQEMFILIKTYRMSDPRGDGGVLLIGHSIFQVPDF
jgi:hypothetical protein